MSLRCVLTGVGTGGVSLTCGGNEVAHRTGTMNQKFSTYGYEFITCGDAGTVFNTCSHCGSAIRYYAEFKHIESGEIVYIGQTCFAKATPEQKRQFSLLERRARIAKKSEKFLANNPIGIRLQAYCSTHSKSEDKHSDNWMLFLKKDHLIASGSFNNAELGLVERLLIKVGA